LNKVCGEPWFPEETGKQERPQKLSSETWSAGKKKVNRSGRLQILPGQQRFEAKQNWI